MTLALPDVAKGGVAAAGGLPDAEGARVLQERLQGVLDMYQNLDNTAARMRSRDRARSSAARWRGGRPSTSAASAADVSGGRRPPSAPQPPQQAVR